MPDVGMLREVMELSIEAQGEALVVERGVVPDLEPGSVLTCGTHRIEIVRGPLQLGDDAWDVWMVISERVG
jgi:hypothetical protein